MLTETDGLEAAIQIVQRTELPKPSPIAPTTRIKGSTAFEGGFNLCRHLILQELREEQNRRFRSKLEKQDG